MKPKYEKPTAMPLGEAAKGSGQCNAGSGVEAGLALKCINGFSTLACAPGDNVVINPPT